MLNDNAIQNSLHETDHVTFHSGINPINHTHTQVTTHTHKGVIPE